MPEIDWANLELYHWLGIGGGAVAVVALILCVALPRVKIPGAILATAAALVAGAGIGVVGMAAFGYQTIKPESPPSDPANAAKMPPGAMMPPGGMAKGMGGLKGMGGPGAFGKGKGPNPKTQLAALVVKIHQLSERPLTLTLDDKSRQIVLSEIKDLGDQEELTDDDADRRLKAILEAVKDERKTLEAAGYRWPDAGGFQPPTPTPPNPFGGGETRDRLIGLQEILERKAPAK